MARGTRGTLGTGMMAPLSMANNFNGPYYAGPSGAAMGALMASQAIADGFRDWGASKGRQQEEALVQAEMDRKRMDELNQRGAVYQALNPGVQMQSANGMSNRDMDRKMALPDAGTQVNLFKIQEGKKQAESEAAQQKLRSFAAYWYLNGGPQTDPTGEKFMSVTGRNPFELVPESVLNSSANRDFQRDMKEEGWRQAQILKQMGGNGGGDSYRFMPMVAPDGSTKIMAINPKDPYAQPIEVGSPPQKAGETQPGLLPMDTNARKNLADWMTQAADASRVASELDTAMGATIDPSTGEKRYKEQPSGMLSGGTGLLIGNLPDKLASRVDPDGVPVRSAIANFSSQIMNALSGAAVSEQEKKRLEAFLPTSSDDWTTLRKKMSGYQDFLRSKGEAWKMTYGDHEVLGRGMGMLSGPTSSVRGKVDRPQLMANDADALIQKYGRK